MWHKIAAFIIKFRIVLLIILLAATGIMGYYASKVELSYEFTTAIPTDNAKYVAYQNFRRQFGEDGNMMVIGVQTNDFFSPAFFNDYARLTQRIEKVKSVENVLSIPGAVSLVKDTVTGSLKTIKLVTVLPVTNVDSVKNAFMSLPFYRGVLYNKDANAYLMAVRIDKKVLNSKDRSGVINEILSLADSFGAAHNTIMHYSGLPLIRTEMATRVQKEMRMFLIISFLLTAVILALFFRSFMAVVASMLVVAAGVIWSVGTIELLGYKITLLTALIPPLIVVIGIPNCVYFLNKYHAEYHKHRDKIKALVRMVDRMGIVTLFTNLTAAIGFGVFFFTKSTLLKEFGLVAGINIISIFFISLIFIPALFSFLPPPKVRHIKYLNSGWINNLLTTLTNWVFGHRSWIYVLTIAACIFSVFGILRLRSEAHIVDDLPKSDKVYQDLLFFENNFKGIMPLEIVIDTRSKYGLVKGDAFRRIDTAEQFIKHFPQIGQTLSIIDGIKFATQASFGGDTNNYALSSLFNPKDLLFYMHLSKGKTNLFSKLISTFVDSNMQKARISVNMADIGSKQLPKLLDSIRPRTYQLFDSNKYTVTFTGTSVVFLEGSRFIINSLRDSLILAFIIIFGCMVFLFRSWRILLISMVVNIVPLLITAGIMGWMGIRIKPSTVLVFSVALGITIDVTIRFLVNFKQELSWHDDSIAETVRRTIHDTGLSIIYTSLILIAGFGVFILSDFDGTKSLGYLTSMTLFMAMVTNLTLQPALLMWMDTIQVKKSKAADFLLDEDGEGKPQTKAGDYTP
ncbi:MAG: MMPL family transporter [Taibaiella sp.]|nr:MMPL family transporter [Taibaiella sp.]